MYYEWKQANKSSWRRRDNQITSLTMLQELGNDYHCEIFRNANFRTMGKYICALIDALKSKTRQVTIDATFGTKNAAMDLYAPLAELDGTRVPMIYFFVKKNKMTGSGSAGTIPQALTTISLTPSFVGCNKDKFKINAIQHVWPSARVRRMLGAVQKTISGFGRIYWSSGISLISGLSSNHIGEG